MKHTCPNCGNVISNKFGFCTTVMFGVVLPSQCEQEFEAYWAKRRKR